MDELLPEGVRQLAGQGTGWALFCFAIAALVWLYRKTNTDRERAESEKHALQEKRIEEARETVRTLHEGAQANIRMAAALEQQAQSRHALFELVTQMERDMERNNESWKPQAQNFERKLDEILRLLQEILRRREP